MKGKPTESRQQLKLGHQHRFSVGLLGKHSLCPLKRLQEAHRQSLKKLRAKTRDPSPSKTCKAREIEASLNWSLIEPSCLTKEVFAAYQQAFHKLLAKSQLPQILFSILTVYDRWVSLKEEQVLQTQQVLATTLEIQIIDFLRFG